MLLIIQLLCEIFDEEQEERKFSIYEILTENVYIALAPSFQKDTRGNNIIYLDDLKKAMTANYLSVDIILGLIYANLYIPKK